MEFSGYDMYGCGLRGSALGMEDQPDMKMQIKWTPG